MGKEQTQFKAGNPGKPKGAKNKVNNEIRAKFEQLLDAVSVEQLAEDLRQLKPVERLNVVMGLAEYITPKLARVQQKHDMPIPEMKPIVIIHENPQYPGLKLANCEKDVMM